MRTLSAFIRKTPSNPLEELQKRLQAGMQNLFPTAKQFIGVPQLETPPSHVEADYSFSAFSVSSLLKKNPAVIAAQIIDYFSKANLPLVQNLSAIGPYVNIEVDKILFNNQALEHIYRQGKNFGSTKNHNPTRILVNYHVSDFITPLSPTGLRQLLTGHVVGACYEQAGNNVIHTYYIADWDMYTLGFLYALHAWPNQIKRSDDPLKMFEAANGLLQKKMSSSESVRAHMKIFFRHLESGDGNFIGLFQSWRSTLLNQFQHLHKTLGARLFCYNTESNFIKADKDVIIDALKKGVAECLSYTNTIITSPFEGVTSLVLQKHDGSSTNLTRHIAALKQLVFSAKPTTLIYVCSADEAELVNEILITARRLDYLTTDMKTSVLATDQADDSAHYPVTDHTLQCSLSRVPFEKKITLSSKNIALYSRIAQLMTSTREKNKAHSEKDIFKITKLLTSFPFIITDVQHTHAPDLLCSYLEEIADQCERLHLQTQHNGQLARAIATVVCNCLNLLTF